MIIECPACATRYVVPDSAIGAEGRTVRCAKCRHSWFQDGPDIDPSHASAAAAPPSPVPSAAPSRRDPVEPAAAGSGDEERRETPAPSPEPARPAPEPREGGEDEPPVGEERVPPPPITAPAEPDGSQFDAAPPFRRRRNPLKLWTWAAAIFALLAAATIFAASYWGLPEWVPVSRPDFAVADPALQLDFPVDQQVKREMPNGSEYFAINGTITNTGSTTRPVPPIRVVLRDARERMVFESEVVPSQRTIGPGESIGVTEAFLDVPRAARVAEIGWKPS